MTNTNLRLLGFSVKWLCSLMCLIRGIMDNDKIVFYSWQSDLPAETTRYGIRDALKKTLKETNKVKSVDLVYDEATRNLPGSPNIPHSIFNKIQKASVFVCDVTTINRDAKKDIRRSANPNVLVELGYAIALLGWERIILLFNETYGTFPDDLPFDFDRHRIMRFSIQESDVKTGILSLSKKLKTGISLIIDRNPKYPAKDSKLSDREVIRLKDLDNLQRILSTVNFEELDKFVEDLPKRIHNQIPIYHDVFEIEYSSTSFYVYDEDIRKSLDDFATIWHKIMSYKDHYEYDFHTYFVFFLEGDVFPDQETEEIFNNIRELKIKLHHSYRKLLKLVNSKFVEIDIRETNKIAYRRINRSK